MEQEGVAVGILEEGHPADARLDRLTFELHALRLELGARRVDVVHAQREPGRRRCELLPDARRIEDVERHLAAAKLHVGLPLRLDLEAERAGVERPRPLPISGRNADCVDLRDRAQPTEPSIWSWISRFISTAYSSGSSLVIGSTKPLTIIALASASVSPRDMR